MEWLTLGLGKLIGMGETWVAAKQKQATAKVEGKIALNKATTESKITIMENDAAASNNIDLITVKNKNNSIMDNVVVCTILSPFWLMFIPYFQPYIESGFSAFSEAPEWYKYCVYGVVISELGLRRIAMKLFDTIQTVRTGKYSDTNK